MRFKLLWLKFSILNLDSNEYFSSKRITDAYYKSESNSVKLNLNLNKKKAK